MASVRARRRGRTIGWGGVGVLVATVAAWSAVLVAPVVALPIAVLPNTEISLAVDADGTAPFADPTQPANAVGQHTPGYDAGANNGIVRTYDTIRYRIDWNVNEVAATAVTLTATLPAGVSWQRDVSGLVAPGCADDPLSSISADGRTITCVLGDKPQGTAGTIFPVALVGSHVDADLIPLTATLSDTNAGAAPTVSNAVQTIVSATASANWVKGTPDEFLDVTNAGVLGRLYVYPISLQPGSLGRRGSEPLDDTATYAFYDNAWGLATGAILAPQALLDTYAPGRTSCGGYDGSGGLPLGRLTANSSPANTTLGAQTGGTIVCTDGATDDYSVRLDVAGQNTQTLATRTANGRTNLSMSITAQIAWWVPESALRDRAGAPAAPAAFAGGLNLGNDISASPMVGWVYPANPATTIPIASRPVITPIQVRTISGQTVNESSTTDNRVEGQVLFAQAAGSGSTVNYVHFEPGPYQEVEYLDRGFTQRGFDRRVPAMGGGGYSLDMGNGTFPPNGTQNWPGTGKVSRNQLVTITSVVAAKDTVASPAMPGYLNSCTAIDTAHMQLVAMPASFTVTKIAGTAIDNLAQSQPTGTTASAPNAGPLATVYSGYGSYLFSAVHGSRSPAATNTGKVVVEFAHTSPTYQASPVPLVGNPNSIDPSDPSAPSGSTAPPVGDVAGNADTNGVSCNQPDADGRGWVPSNGNLAVFDTDSDGHYEGINLVRVRMLTPLNSNEYALNGQVDSVGGVGAGIALFLQAQINAPKATNPNGSTIYVHNARSFGKWDPTVATQPYQTVGTCRSGTMNSAIDPVGGGRSLPKGWCNRPYNTANEPLAGSDRLDPNALESLNQDLPAIKDAVHTDKLTIVEAQPVISKVNVAGLNDFVRNGDTATFQIVPRVVGANVDVVTNIRVSDTLPSTMQFVSATPAPATIAGQTLSWTFGDQAGGWVGPTITVTVRISGASSNTAIANPATIRGVLNGDVADTVRTSSAYVYTPPGFRESSIVKGVAAMQGPCTRFPEPPGSPTFPAQLASTWAANCSRTTRNGPLTFTLRAANTGDTLTDYRVVDVLPYVGDGTEIQDTFSGSPNSGGSGNDGDGRTPPSSFVGTVAFVSLTGTAVGDTVLYSADAPASISRDPDESSLTNTWCTAVTAGTATFGSGACPTGAATVTAIMIRRATFTPGASVTWTLNLQSASNDCASLYTNSFGARASGTPQASPAPTATDTRLEQRSNDVSVMIDCPLVSVGDRAWVDTNHDGTQSSDEPSLAGVKVTLTDASGVIVGTTTTDVNGFYSFVDLVAGVAYTATFSPPAGYLGTLQTAAGSTPGNDSNANPLTGVATFTTPLTGSNSPTTPDDPTIDAGFFLPVSVGDYVFVDVNRDGLQDATDLPVSGVTATLYLADGTTPAVDAAGVAVAAQTTDALGHYLFTNLPPGQYVVKFTTLPVGYTLTTSADVAGTANDSNGTTATSRVLGSGGQDLTLDLGLVSLDLALNKQLANAGPFYAGSTVTFTLTPRNNGPAGALAGWSVTEVLPNGLTLVSMAGSGYTCAAATCVSSAPLAAGGDGPPITVTATVAKAFVGSLHNVAYISPLAAEVTEANSLVVPTTATDTSSTTTNNDAQADLNVASLVSVGDFVWLDSDRDGMQTPGEVGMSGVTVQLKDANGVIVATTTTDPNGFYSFVDLIPGAAYSVTFTGPTGFVGTAPTAPGSTPGNDSNADPVTGVATFTTPPTGNNSPTTPDDPTIDAGFSPPMDLSLVKVLTSAGPFQAGSSAVYTITPHNNGPGGARPGWSVTEVLPVGLSLESLTGNGYMCVAATCTASGGLAAGADGPAITVTATVTRRIVGTAHNVAYITPSTIDVAETNPLVVPTTATDTTLTPTNNDAQADLVVINSATELPRTGSDLSTSLSVAAIVLALGLVLVAAAFRRRRTVS